MSAGHTPGPWRIDNWRDGESSGGDIVFGDGRHDLIAIIAGGNYCCWRDQDDNGEAEFRANARLIAAAPELLDAGDNLAKVADSKLCTVRELAEAVMQWRAAAAKATGQ